MYCRKCGNKIASSLAACPNCGTLSAAFTPQVPNHLVGSILVTLFCCQIFGIIAIIYAAQVNSKLAAGDVQGAIECSNKAAGWMWCGFGLGLLSILLGLGMAAT